MLEEVLRNALRPVHRDYGLYLEDTGLFLYLKRGDKTFATWITETVKVAMIQDTADKIIKEEA